MDKTVAHSASSKHAASKDTQKSLVTSKPLMDSCETVYRLALSFLLVTAFISIPTAAEAAGTDPLSQTLCMVVGWFTGQMGQAIATLGIIVLGIGAMMGKVSWQMALTVAFGVSVMFSGARVVELLTDRSAGFCTGVGGFSSGMIEEVLCNLASMANQPAGRAFGTLAVIFLGISALMGKVSAGVGLLLTVGIGTFYKADDIAQALAGSLGAGWIGCSP